MVDIARGDLEDMFDRMRAKYQWDVDGPLLWGYFFIGNSSEVLERAATLLVEQGYTFVDIHLQEKEDAEDTDQWWLHVERVEHHTVESLDERNAQLNAFAESNELVCYDGMDVGPAA